MTVLHHLQLIHLLKNIFIHILHLLLDFYQKFYLLYIKSKEQYNLIILLLFLLNFQKIGIYFFFMQLVLEQDFKIID